MDTQIAQTTSMPIEEHGSHPYERGYLAALDAVENVLRKHFGPYSDTGAYLLKDIKALALLSDVEG